MISQFSFPPSSLARLPPSSSSSSLPAQGDEPEFHVSVGRVPFLLWGFLHLPPPPLPPFPPSHLSFRQPPAPECNTLLSWAPSAPTPGRSSLLASPFPSNSTFCKDTAILGQTFPKVPSFRIQRCWVPRGQGEPSTSGHHFGVGLPSSPCEGGLCLNILGILHRFLSCHPILWDQAGITPQSLWKGSDPDSQSCPSASAVSSVPQDTQRRDSGKVQNAAFKCKHPGR